MDWGLVGAAAGLAGLGHLFGNNSAKEQFKYQQRLNREAFQHDVDMWNRQNAYNTPSAQMERLQAAGLNPNLVYGNGGATNTANSAPTYNAGTAPDVAAARQAAGSLANAGFNTAINAKLSQVQAANIEADTKLKETQGNLNQTNNEIALIDKYLKQNTVDGNIQYQLEKWKQDLVLGRNQIKLGEQQFTLNQFQMRKLDAETGNILANTKLTKEQAEQVSIYNQFLPDVLRSQIANNNANAYNAIQHGRLAIKQAETEQYRAFTEFARGNLVRSEADLKEIEHYIASHTIDDVIRSKHFQSLERETQYIILRDFGYLKAMRKTLGADDALFGVGTLATSAAINLVSGLNHTQVTK